MQIEIQPSRLNGTVVAPPSKSMAHRLLIFAALAKGVSTISNIAYSQDILATMDCLESFGVTFERSEKSVVVNSTQIFKNIADKCYCRESGSTLRFLIPFAFVTGRKMEYYGSERLLQRPLDIYQSLSQAKGFLFENDGQKVTVEGKLTSGYYQVAGNISSQFITGLMIALSLLDGDSVIEVTGKFESRSYIDLTVQAMKQFGGQVRFEDQFLYISKSDYQPMDVSVEADDSNAAFLDCYNYLGSSVFVEGLNPKSQQGDRYYHDFYPMLANGNPTISLKDCPDLGPILMAMAALLNGATFIDTARLAAKECDRGQAMKQELEKMGGQVEVNENSIVVYSNKLHPANELINGHNDHRIVMAMSTVCTVIGGKIDGCEAINKSFPDYFDRIKQLGAKVEEI